MAKNKKEKKTLPLDNRDIVVPKEELDEIMRKLLYVGRR